MNSKVEHIAKSILAAEQVNFTANDIKEAIEKLSNMTPEDILKALTKSSPSEGLSKETITNTVVTKLKHSGKFNFSSHGLNTWYAIDAYDKTVEVKPVAGTVYVFWNGKEIFAAY